MPGKALNRFISSIHEYIAMVPSRVPVCRHCIVLFRAWTSEQELLDARAGSFWLKALRHHPFCFYGILFACNYCIYDLYICIYIHIWFFQSELVVSRLISQVIFQGWFWISGFPIDLRKWHPNVNCNRACCKLTAIGHVDLHRRGAKSGTAIFAKCQGILEKPGMWPWHIMTISPWGCGY